MAFKWNPKARYQPGIFRLHNIRPHQQSPDTPQHEFCRVIKSPNHGPVTCQVGWLSWINVYQLCCVGWWFSPPCSPPNLQPQISLIQPAASHQSSVPTWPLWFEHANAARGNVTAQSRAQEKTESMNNALCKPRPWTWKHRQELCNDPEPKIWIRLLEHSALTEVLLQYTGITEILWFIPSVQLVFIFHKKSSIKSDSVFKPSNFQDFR